MRRALAIAASLLAGFTRAGWTVGGVALAAAALPLSGCGLFATPAPTFERVGPKLIHVYAAGGRAASPENVRRACPHGAADVRGMEGDYEAYVRCVGG